MGKMLTTRDIDVSRDDKTKKLKTKTTKDIEVKYIDKDAPPEAPEGPMVTTHNVEEFQKKAKKKKPVKKAAPKVEKKVKEKEEAPAKKLTEGKRVIKRK